MVGRGRKRNVHKSLVKGLYCWSGEKGVCNPESFVRELVGALSSMERWEGCPHYSAQRENSLCPRPSLLRVRVLGWLGRWEECPRHTVLAPCLRLTLSRVQVAGCDHQQRGHRHQQRHSRRLTSSPGAHSNRSAGTPAIRARHAGPLGTYSVRRSLERR